ncbi:MAG: DinB family protein [Janthinobacterium lividum]
MQKRRMVGVGLGLAMGMIVAGNVPGQAPVAGHTPVAAPAGPVGPAAEVQRSYAGLKTNILKAANAMPGDEYNFKPIPEIRTFARVVNHVSEAQLHACGAANGTATSAMPTVPPETSDKATILQALQESFAECDKAFAAITDSNATDMLPLGAARRSRIGLLWGTVSHDNEQYATLALYMRLKGLLPPSSEK